MNNRELFLLVSGILFLCLAIVSAVGADIAEWGYKTLSNICCVMSYAAVTLGFLNITGALNSYIKRKRTGE